MIDRPAVVDNAMRVALLTPSGSDSALAMRVLADRGLTTHACKTISDLADAITSGFGALLVAEEALGRDVRERLIQALDAQAHWSDIPMVLLLTKGELSSGLSPGVRAIVKRGNVTLLERPVRVATLVAALEAALRGRARQYEIRDAAARRAVAERRVRESEELLRAAVESAPYPLMVHASDGQVVHLSRTWTDLTGYRVEDLRTVKAWVDLAYGEQAEQAREHFKSGGETQSNEADAVSVWEREVRTRDGAPRLWSFRAANLGELSDGRGLRLVAAVDVTEMRRLVRNERQLRAEAEEANRAKMQFLATMSHELRTPLNAIGGHAQLMEMEILGPVTEQQAEALRRVRRAESHLLGLINDVLNFAKIEAGRVIFDIEEFSIDELLDSVEVLIEQQVSAKALTYERLPGDEARILADVDKARQVLLNLLSNAVKFTNGGGKITLQCTLDGNFAVVLVRDTGIGIPARLLESMFEPFVQVRADFAGQTAGTGLGLAISRDLARAMAGDLTAESEEGVGSVFSFRLPLAPVDATAPPQTPGEVAAGT